RVVEGPPEGLQPGPVEAGVAGGHVAEGEPDGQEERDGDERDHVHDRRQQEPDGELAVVVGEAPGRPGRGLDAGSPGGGRVHAQPPIGTGSARSPLSASKNRSRSGWTANWWVSPAAIGVDTVAGSRAMTR